MFSAPSASFADGRVVRFFYTGEEPWLPTGCGSAFTRRMTRRRTASADDRSYDDCSCSRLRHGAAALVDTFCATGVIHRHDRKAPRTPLAERIRDLVTAGRAEANLSSQLGVEREIGVGV
jgi:hypothetical protein